MVDLKWENTERENLTGSHKEKNVTWRTTVWNTWSRVYLWDGPRIHELESWGSGAFISRWWAAPHSPPVSPPLQNLRMLGPYNVLTEIQLYWILKPCPTAHCHACNNYLINVCWIIEEGNNFLTDWYLQRRLFSSFSFQPHPNKLETLLAKYRCLLKSYYLRLSQSNLFQSF